MEGIEPELIDAEREPDLPSEDIRGALTRIERYTSAIDREQFRSDEKTIDAVARNLEIIGEAARLLPNEFKSKYPNIPGRRFLDFAIGLSTTTLD